MAEGCQPFNKSIYRTGRHRLWRPALPGKGDMYMSICGTGCRRVHHHSTKLLLTALLQNNGRLLACIWRWLHTLVAGRQASVSADHIPKQGILLWLCSVYFEIRLLQHTSTSSLPEASCGAITEATQHAFGNGVITAAAMTAATSLLWGPDIISSACTDCAVIIAVGTSLTLGSSNHSRICGARCKPLQALQHGNVLHSLQASRWGQFEVAGGGWQQCQ